MKGVLILVFDLSNRSSFDELFNRWVPEAKSVRNTNDSLIIVGNKADMR